MERPEQQMPNVSIRRDTTEHALEYNKGDQKFDFNDERGKEWGEIVKIYRKNNKNRSIDNIGEEQNLLEEQKNREDSGRRKKLREGRGRYVSERRKIQEKEAEGITHSKGAEKTDQKRYS